MTTTSSDLRRANGHTVDEIYKVIITRGFTDNPTDFVLVTFGNTRAVYTASVEQSASRFERDSGGGWLTAEYSMLPAPTHECIPRGSTCGKIRGRTHETSHLISRSPRAAIDLRELGENTIDIGCDALQADDGTRTASITGTHIALADVLAYLHAVGAIPGIPLKAPAAAVLVGIVGGCACLDLPYEEDFRTEVDLNVAMTAESKFVEIQGTGEGDTFDHDQLNDMLDSAEKDLRKLIVLQQEVLHAPYPGKLS